MAEKITLEIKKETVAWIIFVLIFGASMAGLYFYEENQMKNAVGIAQNESIQLGYQQGLYEIAYFVAKDGSVTYKVPTTNTTITLIAKQ